MKIVHYSDVPAAPVEAAGSVGVQIRWLIAKDDGAPNFAMRHFEIAPGGRTPQHHHPWEHEVFVLEGNGAVLRDGKEVPLNSGMAVFVPGEEDHCFLNKGETPFRFLCLIPVET
jgi:quercetin dioxygenase-like cupin family protein